MFTISLIGEFGGTEVTILLIPIVMIQNWLEKRVYEEKDIFQKFSWNDWYSEKVFEYEHMSTEKLNMEIERISKIDD